MIDTGAIPAELRRERRWLLWRFEQRDGKATKVPWQPCDRHASSTDSSTWSTFEAASKALEGGGFDGLGFALGDGWAGVDLDGCRDSNGELTGEARALVNRFGSYAESSPSGRGVHILVRGVLPDGARRNGVEVYSSGRYFTVTGAQLEGAPGTVEHRQGELEQLYAQLRTAQGNNGKRATAPAPPVAADSEGDLGRTHAALLELDPAYVTRWERRGEWADDSRADFSLAVRLLQEGETDDQVIGNVLAASRMAHGDRDVRKVQRRDYLSRTIAEARARVAADGTDGSASRPASHHPATHTANAERFIARSGDRARWTPGGGWLLWSGKVWEQDADEARLADLMADVAPVVFDEAAELKRLSRSKEDEKRADELFRWARASHQEEHIRKSLRRARGGLRVTVDQLDRDRLLLNLENGILDLRSGTLRPHDPGELCTKLAPARFDSRAEAPHWGVFLRVLTGDSETLREYLQRAVGYTLSGDTREQCLFLLLGSGANGKSTFLDALLGLLGGYATKTLPELLFATNQDRHPTEVADLAGVRLAVAQEVEEGRRWATQRLKELTGETVIKARRLYCNPFTFSATFKLWVAVNHRPQTTDSTDALWRRLRVIPCRARIVRPDKELGTKLAAERSGILNWALEGFRRWREGGLPKSVEVQAAVEEYRRESDVLGRFLEECAILGEGFSTRASELFAAYEAFCHSQGEERLSGRQFKAELVERGHVVIRRTAGNFYTGLELRDTANQPASLHPGM